MTWLLPTLLHTNLHACVFACIHLALAPSLHQEFDSVWCDTSAHMQGSCCVHLQSIHALPCWQTTLLCQKLNDWTLFRLAPQISAPLAVIGGHTKAVSYVRWVGSNQVISASTDNSLKLWDVADAAQSEGKCAPITSFTGEWFVIMQHPLCTSLLAIDASLCLSYVCFWGSQVSIL